MDTCLSHSYGLRHMSRRMATLLLTSTQCPAETVRGEGWARHRPMRLLPSFAGIISPIMPPPWIREPVCCPVRFPSSVAFLAYLTIKRLKHHLGFCANSCRAACGGRPRCMRGRLEAELLRPGRYRGEDAHLEHEERGAA